MRECSQFSFTQAIKTRVLIAHFNMLNNFLLSTQKSLHLYQKWFPRRLQLYLYTCSSLKKLNLPSWDMLGTESLIKIQRWVSGLQTEGDRRRGGSTTKESVESNILCPALPFSGVHRQVLLATVGWFLGYHLTKYENYYYAKLDRDMNEYIRLHPEEFPPKGEWIISGFVLVRQKSP